MTTSADEFETHRPRLFGLAYRLLGSAADAEGTVQDAYLRFSDADRTVVEQPAAWLAQVVTNLCLNRLTSARARRERYTGSRLPEPAPTSDGTLGPLESAERRDEVSLALLVLLERLTPTERAVYVLREASRRGTARSRTYWISPRATAVSCTGGRPGGLPRPRPGSRRRRSSGRGSCGPFSRRRETAIRRGWRSSSPRT